MNILHLTFLKIISSICINFHKNVNTKELYFNVTKEGTTENTKYLTKIFLPKLNLTFEE